MEKSELNPTALGYGLAAAGLLLVVGLRIAGFIGYGRRGLNTVGGFIISRSGSPIWIIPELIQVAIILFAGGYLIAYIYNRFS